MLNEFRTQQIRWDKATRKIYDTVQANASDSNGRKLHVQITNDGMVEDLTGATVSLYWESRDGKNKGLDALEAVDISKGEFELFYTTGMLSNVGRLNAALVLVDSTGKTVSDWFTISNIRGINEDAIESSNEFTALTEALVKVNDLEENYAPRLNEVAAQVAQKAQKEVAESAHARIDNLVIPLSPENANIAVTDAQVSTVKNKTFPSIRDRFESAEYDIGNVAKYFTREIAEWRKGYIASSGTVAVESPNKHITSQNFLSFKAGDKAVLLEPDLYDMRVGKYTKSGDTFSFVERTGLLKEYTFDSSFYYLIGLQRVGITEITDVQIPIVGNQVIIPASNPVITQEILSEQLKGIGEDEPKGTHKMMHFSVDDFISPFQDITDNADTYTSIFDNSFFAFLKSRHEKYGIKASMFCFYENTDATFNLSQCTDKFASEFRENSDWLRFGFHAYNINSDYNAADVTTALSDYNTVINELLRICGGYSAIDQAPRIHFYAGTLANVRAWKGAKGGVIGFLTAEDTRDSYYHDSSQTAKLQSNDRWYDEQENLLYFGTDIRLDNDTTPYNTLQSRNSDPNYGGRMNDLVLFMHDTGTYLTNPARLQRLTDCMEFAVENGYRFAFPMDIANGKEA